MDTIGTKILVLIREVSRGIPLYTHNWSEMKAYIHISQEVEEEEREEEEEEDSDLMARLQAALTAESPKPTPSPSPPPTPPPEPPPRRKIIPHKPIEKLIAPKAPPKPPT